MFPPTLTACVGQEPLSGGDWTVVAFSGPDERPLSLQASPHPSSCEPPAPWLAVEDTELV